MESKTSVNDWGVDGDDLMVCLPFGLYSYFIIQPQVLRKV